MLMKEKQTRVATRIKLCKEALALGTHTSKFLRLFFQLQFETFQSFFDVFMSFFSFRQSSTALGELCFNLKQRENKKSNSIMQRASNILLATLQLFSEIVVLCDQLLPDAAVTTRSVLQPIIMKLDSKLVRHQQVG